jgi:hypothetical protein
MGFHKPPAEEELRNLHAPAAIRNHRNPKVLTTEEHRNHRNRKRREVCLSAAYDLLEELRTERTVVHRKALKTVEAARRTDQRTVRQLRIRTVDDWRRMIRTAEEVVDYRRNRNLGSMEDNQTWRRSFQRSNVSGR